MQSTVGTPSPNRALVVTVAVLVLGAVLRLLFLGADPAYEMWDGYVTDEGRWTEQARRLVLFGSLEFDGWYQRMHFMLAPLHQAATTLSFAVFGVGFASARLVSALAGIGLLISTFRVLRPRFSSEGLLLTILVLALQPDLLSFSRFATPEVTTVLFQCVALLVLVSSPGSVRAAGTGGLLVAVALGFRVTEMPIVAIFAAITWTISTPGDRKTRWYRTAAFIAAVFVPALAVLGIAFVAGALPPVSVSDLGSIAARRLQLVSTYHAVSRALYHPFMAPVNALLLGLWTIAGMLIAAGRIPASRARDVYIGSGIWILGWLGMVALLRHFPLYYTFHVFTPIALHLGAGVTLLQSHDAGGAADRLTRLDGWAAKIAASWLFLPLALLLSRVAIGGAEVAGLPIDRLSHRLAMIGVVDLALLAVATRWKARGLTAWAVLVPLVAIPLWMLEVRLGMTPLAFWETDGLRTIVMWGGTLLIGAAVAALVVARGDPRQQGWRWPSAYVLSLAIVWAIQIAPKYLAPSYTIAETSAALEAEIGGSETVVTMSAASLFLGNRLDYVDYDPHNHRVASAQALVAIFEEPQPPLRAEFRLIRTFDLALPPLRSQVEPELYSLRLYRRAD